MITNIKWKNSCLFVTSRIHVTRRKYGSSYWGRRTAINVFYTTAELCNRNIFYIDSSYTLVMQSLHENVLIKKYLMVDNNSFDCTYLLNEVFTVV